MGNELFGYSLFTESPEPIRTLNRTVVVGNILRAGSRDMAKEYLEQFSDRDRLAILTMQIRFNKEGVDVVKRDILKDVQWEEAE